MAILITELDGFTVGNIYLISAGWYKGKTYKLEYISHMPYERITSGYLTESNVRLNVPFKHLSTNTTPIPDRAANVRKMAQKLLQAGKREQALKLLKTLK